jgi:monoamine oxidase
LRRRVAGRWQYDERHLCHAPQERLFFQGQWQEGLLPLNGVGASTLAQYLRFAREVERARAGGAFRIPLRSRDGLRAWDGETFAAWLGRHGLDDPQLRWYLDYCCRDDYGADSSQVAAWAGLHYFAARHGFHPPGSEAEGEREALLTWPQGNGWLVQALAAPLGDRFRGDRLVLRIAERRHGIEVDAIDAASGRVERWLAGRCIVALPAFVAGRVVENPPEPLRLLASQLRYAPWLVANLHLREPLTGHAGPAPAWDNVLYGTRGLGYVDARHQSLDPRPGPTVLTWYRPLGDEPDARRMLMTQPWSAWRDAVLAELSVPHPDLAGKTTRIDITRYGHAMSIPVPGTLAAWSGHAALRAEPLSFAHSDWAGYSIFEEAFSLGHSAGTSCLQRMGARA